MLENVIPLSIPAKDLREVVDRMIKQAGGKAQAKIGRAMNPQEEEFIYVVVRKPGESLPKYFPSLVHQWSSSSRSLPRLFSKLKAAGLPVNNLFLIEGKVRCLMARALTSGEKKSLDAIRKSTG